MDGTRFDELTRRFGAGLNRRQVLRGILGGAGVITAVTVFEERADAQGCDPNADTITCPAGTHHEGQTKKPVGGCCNGNGNCCTNICTDGFCGEAGPTCSEEGVECGAGCCEGLECIDGVCLVPCTEEGGECGSSDECCDILLCIEGLCLPCTEEGGECSSHDECCDILLCIEGVCAPPPCTEEGGECGSSDECCDVLLCIEGLCAPPLCTEEGGECSSHDECCDVLLCIEGNCTPPEECLGEKEACVSSDECCKGLDCIDRLCEVVIIDLPKTGTSGGVSRSSGMLGATIAGGAAAFIAAKVLRRKPANEA